MWPTEVSVLNHVEQGIREHGTTLIGQEQGRSSLIRRTKEHRPLPSTTTVVMKAHESVDERLAGAHVVDNGFDVPTAASSCGTTTRPAAPQANGLARAAQSPTSGAPLAPSTPQTHPLGRFFPLLLQLDAGQPGMGHHG